VPPYREVTQAKEALAEVEAARRDLPEDANAAEVQQADQKVQQTAHETAEAVLKAWPAKDLTHAISEARFHSVRLIGGLIVTGPARPGPRRSKAPA
jgi:cell fate (sporulation/competence/biofilm development) regulator YlbF (YheA/YmcA/DUF963 family)